MTMRMLIDARHREETRVAVVKGTRIEEFDFESAERKQLKGNIYLAKVTRVEPSLQAAFIDYGGNRHGFLAFSEIHPDYYQIPKEDREALLREEAEHAAEEAALRNDQDDDDDDEDGDDDDRPRDQADELTDDHTEHDDEGEAAAPPAESAGNGADEGTVEALRTRRMNLRRRYKIQDVIRRRQVLLVQVVKEERGNKGAALTTYLSLAGRYCVLMPNTSHGGGISRKISNVADRKRLKSIMADLKLPQTMGCIVRTAGLQRTKVEIKRDFDYLARLWDGIRDTTLSSSAPALIYGDSDLIKRAIRDIYNREIDEVIVEGEDGYRQAKEFMRMLMPSHARRVKHYSDAVPLFQRNAVEDQLAAMYNPVVQLKSGGYLVINPTEALVSIDINSGRSTREHNIEQTATATNIEAATEIARQLRLRDMAGLIVIDFIDMDNNSNNRKVEKTMKDALKNDRARIQVGRISSFGLMEMSRQRLRTGVLEASTRVCPHCEGTGLVRTASSAGLSALRMIEDEAARGRGSQLLLRASQEAAFYVLNRKRAELAEIEDRYGVTIVVAPDGEMEGARMAVEAGGPPPLYPPRIDPVVIEEPEDDIPEDIEEEEDEEEVVDAREPREPREPREARAPRGDGDAEGEGGRRRRRRRGRRGRKPEGEEAGEQQVEESVEQPEAGEVGASSGEQDVADVVPESESEGGSRRRRGRRGRRGGTSRIEADAGDSGPYVAPSMPEIDPVALLESEPVLSVEVEPAAKPKRPRKRPSARTEDVIPVVAEAAPQPEATDAVEMAEAAEVVKPKRARRAKAKPESGVEAEAVAAETAEPVPETESVAKPKRRAKPKAAAVPTEPEIGAAETPAAPETGSTPAADSAAAAGDDAVAAIAEASPPANEASSDTGEAEAAGPARRGWWQRTFGQ